MTPMTSLVIISDIHGNLPALEAVRDDVQRLAPDAVYVLGDMVNGAPWSGPVLDLIRAEGWPMLLGNHEDAVLQLTTPRMEPRYALRERYAMLWWARESLRDRHLALIDGLPREHAWAPPGVPPLRLLHGVPGNFFIGFRPDAPEEWAVSHLAGVPEGTVAGGHTHCAMVRHFGQWQVVNSGSVGAPYDGDTRASYALLTGDASGWRGEVRRVAYDLDAVDDGFRASGLLKEAGVPAEMTRRSVLTGLPWVADFFWWMRSQPAEVLASMSDAQRIYDTIHGPGRWAFPYAS
jgi:predicted phosphodiesterase